MRFAYTTARRSAALLAIIGLTSCDAPRSLAPDAGRAADRAGGPSALVPYNRLVNPSFEDGGAGWVIGYVGGIDRLWQASQGYFSVDLNGVQPGQEVSQFINTEPGYEYIVNFDLAGNPGAPQGLGSMEVQLDEAGVYPGVYRRYQRYDYNTTGKSLSDMGWQTRTFRFVAQTWNAKLSFHGTDRAQAHGPVLDNVNVYIRDEPSHTPTTVAVSFGPGPFVYTGTAFTASAIVSPATPGSTTIAYVGNCTDVGTTCYAEATFVGGASGYPEHAVSRSTFITITAAPTTTTVSCPASVSYTGSARTPCTATVTGPGLSTSTPVSYADNVSAGTATATAGFAGTANLLASSASKTFTIGAATTTAVTFGPGPFVYSGAAFTATASVSPAAAGSANIVYSGDCIGAGSTCTATATFAGSSSYTGSTATTSITIAKATTTTAVSCPASVTYTGSALTPCTATVTGPGPSTSTPVSYADNVNAGTATAAAGFAGTANLLASSASKTFAITAAATTTAVSFGPDPFVYSGAAFTATASVSPAAAGSANIVYSGDCTGAGSTCTATATFAGSSLYTGSTATTSITIAKAATTTAVSCPASVTYTTGAQTPCTAGVTGLGLSIAPAPTYTDNVNAGTATAAYTFAGTANLLASSGSKTFQITRAASSTTVSCPASVTYTGSALVPCSATATGPGLGSMALPVVYANNTAAGTASASATFAGTANLTGSSDARSFTIAKAATTTTVTFGAGPFFRTGSPFIATATVSPAAAGAATIAYTGDCINAGSSCTATATYAGNGNFLLSGASASITIKLPVASSDEQCKNGGWVYVTDGLGKLFKNQGDCVSFVATKGKNKGAGG